MTDKEKLEEIRKIVETVKKYELDYVEDELWDCGNFDDVYYSGWDGGEWNIAAPILEVLNG